MFGNNRKLKRFNAHVISYKDFLNQNKQRQRNSHILWFKDQQRIASNDKLIIAFRKKVEEDMKKIKEIPNAVTIYCSIINNN